jgi:regulator of replication initiation timing
METIKVEKLSQFFEQIKVLTFWRRLFQWSQVRSLSYEAYEEFKLLLSQVGKWCEDIAQTKTDVSILRNDNEHLKTGNATLDNEARMLKSRFDDSLARISVLSAQLAARDETIRQVQTKQKQQEIELCTSKEKINQLAQENSQLRQENTIFRQTDSDRKTKYQQDVAALNSIREQIQTDRNRETNERQQAEIDRLIRLKETWAKHQDKVQEVIKAICQRHIIEYVDKVPFKGNPDNTIRICDEFVVFDAKSPASDDLSHFPAYIKAQTESVKKYIKEENVKKDVFLVVPANTVHVIGQFSFNMADYNVYIVTLEALEPLILSLKKLEEYEFVEQLAPEERDNICRVIGKFAHMTKRRIQIDQFFGRQFLEILTKCESDLPRELLEKVVEYERSEKLNPPLEKRAKIISSEELQVDNGRIRKEAEAKAIAFPASIPQGIKGLPLYDDDKPDVKES